MKTRKTLIAGLLSFAVVFGMTSSIEVSAAKKASLSSNCGDNKLTTLDVSKNIGLNELRCNHNNITVFDLTQNINLGELVCDNEVKVIGYNKDQEEDI